MAKAGDPKRVQRRKVIPSAEALEARSVPASFGLPWGDARHLTLSFVPDGTAIASHASDLFRILDARQATADWERSVLRAFQTWAVRANINIGLRPDGGQAIGTPGNEQHDPRFGDVRIAAHLMASDALAISVPGGSLASGTWGGDLFLNSDAFDGTGAPDLFGVTLHEAGHVFGLDNSTDPASPMHSHLSGATAPTEADVAELQRLFGARSPDEYEKSGGNESVATATDFPIPSSYDGDRPLVLFADRTTAADADVFEVRPRSDSHGAMTVRLQSAGLSLLEPHLAITDERGHVLGEARADSGFGDTVILRIPEVSPGQRYFLRVDSLARDVFNVGAYGLAVSFDGTSTVDPDVLDRVLGGQYGTPGPEEVDAILRGADRGYLNDDRHTDDGADEAVRLETTPGYAPGSHYETVGSLSDAADVDFYRIRSAEESPGQRGVMTLTVRSLDDSETTPTASILDENLVPVPARVLANGHGVYTIEAVGVTEHSWYYVRVHGADLASEQTTGNYELAVDFPGKAADLTTFAAGKVGGAATSETFDVYVARSQLFHLLLSVGDSSSPGAVVRMNVIDASGTVRFTLGARAGETVSGDALFLTPGAYTLRFAAEGSDLPLEYNLSGQSISDPVGPAVIDPTLRPIYTVPGDPTLPPIYAYPGGILSPIPYHIARPVAPEPVPAPAPAPAPVQAPAPALTPAPAPTPTISATSAAPSVVGVVVSARSRRGLTSVAVGFDGALDPNSASSPALYRVLAGVRRRAKTIFTKPLRIRRVTYDSNTGSVIVSLARPYKGPLQVTVRGGLQAAGGVAIGTDFTRVVR